MNNPAIRWTYQSREQGDAVMAEELEQGQATLALQDEPGEGGEPGKTETYLGTFVDKEAAEKGFDDLQRQRSESQSKLDKATAEIEQLRNDKIDMLAKHIGDGAAASDAARAASNDAKSREYWKEQFEERGVDAQLDLAAQMAADGDTTAKTAFDAALKAQGEKHSTEMAELASRVADQDPTYVAMGPENVEETQKEFGVDRATAMKIRKALTPPEQREDPPGNSGSSARVPPETKTEPADHFVDFWGKPENRGDWTDEQVRERAMKSTVEAAQRRAS